MWSYYLLEEKEKYNNEQIIFIGGKFTARREMYITLIVSTVNEIIYFL